ncbi:antitoxin Xre/MbcA/ParS toxin-binding domain-containing protein [Burkholderia multivorans]|uniref:antitoxin Xre/MbcA/ParS toxin-binding domain-containing protein n=1 Tax=Burkholderia multivorans TaxID=87883 RepID=UPI000D001B21|nr:antitoxin Xre/MbcA/ParS toxin-binding domain-containing protein [Burkholderia multivorans]MBY4791621.1 DUF2384 domain-containing protein [Burkholderia multivorans]PRE59491.1 hypothetical protein C6P86_23510 [Burkholderia multivorans]PRE77050.1 hypothetical protein C6Q00_27435 [Burkholderia multivorans]PRG17266.1 hypothetical protein C6T57_26130 [Burkholderia multivorans]
MNVETPLDTNISERTLQRRKDSASRLDSNASDCLLHLAAVTEQAADVWGQGAAERWRSTGPMALDGRRAIDLLQRTKGTELVKTLLARWDHGAYA